MIINTSFPNPAHARAFINSKHKQTVALLGANSRYSIIPDTDSPTVRDGNVLPADAISRRSSKLVLGQEVHADNYIIKRIKWAQRGIGASSLLDLTLGQLVNSNFLFTLRLLLVPL